MNKVKHALLTVTMLSGIALSSSLASAATEVRDRVQLTVPIACTMSGTGTTHTATLNPGTYSGVSGSEYENGIGKTTLTAICNDDNGFSIYAIGYTDNEYGATNLIGSNTNGTIATKAYTAGDTTSNWSMKVTKVTDTTESYNPQNLTISTGYDAWIAVPDTYTKVAQYKANTGSSTTDLALGVKLETTYAAYIAANQPADTYVGQVKYTMIHPYNAVPPANVSCNPNASTITEAVCMQDFAGPNGDQIASTMTLEQQYTLKDKRDGKSYTIAKLADGNVWMTQNLDLDLDSNVVYTSEDTDLGYDTFGQEYTYTTWSPARSTYSDTDVLTLRWCNGGLWNDRLNTCLQNNTPESYNPGDLYWRDYEGEIQAYESEMSLYMDYASSCLNSTCNESIYSELSPEWRAFVDSCDFTANEYDISLLPPHPIPYRHQEFLYYLYLDSCLGLGVCDENTYSLLDEDWKAYIDSCDANYENCDESLRPVEPEPDIILNQGIPQYHLGNYYNWTAATATNDSSDNQHYAVDWSICPSGWALPRDRDTREDNFSTLWSQYGMSSSSVNGDNALWRQPMYFNASGYYDGALHEIGAKGYYIVPDVYDSNDAESARFNKQSGSLYSNPSAMTERDLGISIRCIARPVAMLMDKD